jgi:DUF1680 family protein
MYITGGIGSCHLGETFSKPYDLPNAEAYTETCAGIGLIFFCHRMLNLENHATYADTIERVFYNGLLSGLSLDGASFFYENPLEITMLEHFSTDFGERRFPPTQRKRSFACSCCPPNINRLFPRLCEYVYGIDGDTLYINQFAESKLDGGDIRCVMKTAYPLDGSISVRAEGVQKIAVRIPAWCDRYTLNKKHTVENGYAIFENDGEAILDFDMTPFTIRANESVIRDMGRICVQAGPVVYCAEGIDNGENLHALAIPADISAHVSHSKEFGLNTIEVEGFRYTIESGALYTRAKSHGKWIPTQIQMIPFCTFGNRGETDMLTWFHEKM